MGKVEKREEEICSAPGPGFLRQSASSEVGWGEGPGSSRKDAVTLPWSLDSSAGGQANTLPCLSPCASPTCGALGPLLGPSEVCRARTVKQQNYTWGSFLPLHSWHCPLALAFLPRVTVLLLYKPLRFDGLGEKTPAMWLPEQDKAVRTQGMCVGKSFPALLVSRPAWVRCPILVTIPDKHVAQPGLEQDQGSI